MKDCNRKGTGLQRVQEEDVKDRTHSPVKKDNAIKSSYGSEGGAGQQELGKNSMRQGNVCLIGKGDGSCANFVDGGKQITGGELNSPVAYEDEWFGMWEGRGKSFDTETRIRKKCGGTQKLAIDEEKAGCRVNTEWEEVG